MTKTDTFKLGATADGTAIDVDIGRLLESRLLITASSGAGKSWLLRRILEQTHGRVQHLVLDVEGDFHTLREKFDYALVAKRGGECLADPRIAETLVHRLLELGVSAVCDLYELKHDERTLFVRRFCEALMDAPKTLWHPVMVCIDEAHKFCAESENVQSTSAVIDVCSRGRRRGFCAVLATQRLAKLHKDAAAELTCKLIGRTTLDIDMKRAGELLGFSSREQRSQLSRLPDGGFFAWGPGMSNEVALLQVGGVTTTHPRPGARATPVPPARARVKQVLGKLADIPREAEAEQKSIEDLRAENARLKRELAAKPKPETKHVETPALSKTDRAAISKGIDALHRSAERFHSDVALLQQLSQRAHDLALGVATSSKTLNAALANKPAPAPPATMYVTKAPTSRVLQPGAASTAGAARVNGADVAHDAVATTGAMSKGERKVLTAIVQHMPDGCTREQLTALTGYKKTTRDEYLRRLATAGYTLQLEVANRIAATDAGIAALGDVEPLPTGSALLEHWLAELTGGERTLLAEIAGVYPARVSRDVLTAATGYKKTTRDEYLRRLEARRLIECGRGDVCARDVLFD